MNPELYSLINELSSTDAKKCMQCGKCSARCPNFEKFDIKPHQFVNFIAKGKLNILNHYDTINYCLTCLECVEACPRLVAPANLINAVKDIQLRQNSEFICVENIPSSVEEDMPQQLIVSAFRKFL